MNLCKKNHKVRSHLLSNIIEPRTFLFVKKLLDLYKLSKEYDAIEVFISDDSELYFSLYGFDCDSIFVMNPGKIIQEND